MTEQKTKEDEAKAKEAQRKQQAESVLNQLKQRVEGFTCSRLSCVTGYTGGNDGRFYKSSEKAFAAGNSSAKSVGCNWDEYKGTNWYDWGSGAVERFDFSEAGKVRLVFIASFPQPSSVGIIGTPEGPSFSDIKWECPTFRVPGDGSFIGTVPAWVSLHEDGSAITYTCDTNSPESNPAARYTYYYFKRN